MVLPLNENINFIFANIILRIERVKYVKYVPLKELSGFIFCLTFVKDALCFILSAGVWRQEQERNLNFFVPFHPSLNFLLCFKFVKLGEIFQQMSNRG